MLRIFLSNMTLLRKREKGGAHKDKSNKIFIPTPALTLDPLSL